MAIDPQIAQSPIITDSTTLSSPYQHANLQGPFDIIGDVHGCCVELIELLTKLGYPPQFLHDAARDPRTCSTIKFPRKLVFVGDLVDRGPLIPSVLNLFHALSTAHQAVGVLGNRDAELLRYIDGEPTKVTRGMQTSLGQLLDAATWPAPKLRELLHTMAPFLILDEGRLIVAHAGLSGGLQTEDSPSTRLFAIYGPEAGGNDDNALPTRLNWAAAYQGTPLVVYGHTPVAEPKWLNRSVNIDTGCVYGGKLTALRYPELETVSVPAQKVYNVRPKPFAR